MKKFAAPTATDNYLHSTEHTTWLGGLYAQTFFTFRTTLVYNKPTRCNSGSIVFINNYKYAIHVSDALYVHHQEHYKL